MVRSWELSGRRLPSATPNWRISQPKPINVRIFFDGNCKIPLQVFRVCRGPNEPGRFLPQHRMGHTSGTIAKTLLHPFDRIKLRLQVQAVPALAPKRNLTQFLSSQVTLVSTIFKSEGIRGFFGGGFTQLVWRYAPLQALNFGFKDGLKPLLPRANPETEFSKFFLIQMTAGGLAGALSQVLLHPHHHYITHKTVLGFHHSHDHGIYSSHLISSESPIENLRRRLMQQQRIPDFTNLVQEANHLGARGLFTYFWSWRVTLPMTFALVIYDTLQRSFP
jgi:hypothetical protein